MPTRPPGGGRRRWHLRVSGVVLSYLLGALGVLAFGRSLPNERWLLVHLALLGAGTTAIVVWSEHFAVALLRAPPQPRRRSAARLTVLTAGVLAVLVGVPTGRTAVLLVGAVLVVAAVVDHLRALAGAARGASSGRFAHTVRHYQAAGAWLVVGCTLGVLLGTGHDDRLHAAHLHANLLGWVALAVLGTLFTLWPTVLRTRMVPGVAIAARRSLLGTAVPLLVLVAGLLIEVRWMAVAGLAGYVGGVLLALVPFLRTARQARPAELAAWSLAAGVSWLVAGVLADLALLIAVPDPTGYLVALERWVPALVAGFVLQTLLGALTYLVPVMFGGGPAAVRTTAVVLATWWRLRLGALNLGLLLVLAGGAGRWPGLLVPVGWLLVAGSLLAFVVLLTAVALPVAVRGPVGGLALGAVITLVPVLIAVSGGTDRGVPQQVRPSGAAAVQQVAVTLVGMDVLPAVIELPAGSRVQLVVTNRDGMRHDLAFPSGPHTPLLGRGQSAVLDLGVVSQDRTGWCTVPGHRAAGMTLDVRVIGAQHAGHGSAVARPTGRAVDVHRPPGPGWRARHARLAPAPPGRLHRVTLRVTEREVEVVPGVLQRVWTFGGTVPGPTLRGRVGDTFEVTLVNEGSTDHGIDFHAGQNAPDQVMRALRPGGSLRYRFTAQHSGAWLYHCSTMPMALHLANGMFGAVVIDPPHLPVVDREYLLVGSELYVGSREHGADPAAIRSRDWDAISFNGYPDQYLHAPLTARVGERVRWWVVAAGPGEGMAFHVVGSQFDTVFAEGAYRLRPGNLEQGAAQVLALAPAQGGFVEQTFVAPGSYPFLDHDLRRGENGARGQVTVTR